MKNVPSFRNKDTGNFIYGREITNALFSMIQNGKRSIEYKGKILKVVGEEHKDQRQIILIEEVSNNG